MISNKTNLSELNTVYMLIALREAIKAEKKNMVPVGSVLVSSKKKILAKDHNISINNKDPISHAEIRVIRKASLKLNSNYLYDSSMYVTLEPCFMCMGAIINSKISNLFFGAYNIKNGASGSIYNLAFDCRFNNSIKLCGGVCFKECSFLIKKYFKKKRI